MQFLCSTIQKKKQNNKSKLCSYINGKKTLLLVKKCRSTVSPFLLKLNVLLSLTVLCSKPRLDKGNNNASCRNPISKSFEGYHENN